MSEDKWKESEWRDYILERLNTYLGKSNRGIIAKAEQGIRYANEIKRYKNKLSLEPEYYSGKEERKFKIDILISESNDSNPNNGCQLLKPRVAIELKKGNITTHDLITYSHKASLLKSVHTDLRYGVLIGKRKGTNDNQLYLPPKILLHGKNFEFIVCWKNLVPGKNEWKQFEKLLELEIKASRMLEHMVYGCGEFTVVHKKLIMN